MDIIVNSKVFITIYLLLLISLGYVCTDIYLPSLPILSVYFHASENQTQMTLFSYLLSFSFSPLIFGPLSDHMGRKKVILGGISLGIFATFCCLFSKSMAWLIFFRFLQGFGMGAVLISSRASVSDYFTGMALAKQMSIMTMLMPLVLATAPTIGGFLQEHFHWQAVFIFLIGYMTILILLIAITPESLKSPTNEKASQIFSKYCSHLKNRLFLIYGINFVLPSLGFFAYLTASPFLFQEVIGLSPAQYGSLSLYVGATVFTTGYINLKLIKYFKVTQILLLGGFLVVLAGSLLLLFHFLNILNTWSLLIPSLIFFTCMPLCLSNGASKAFSFVTHNFGTASALLTTAQFLVGSLGSFIFSLISDQTTLSLALCFILVGILSIINLRYGCKLEAKEKQMKS